MKKALRLLGLTMLCLVLLLCAAQAESVNRALLVGCDVFLTQESTAPSSANNVVQMAATLRGGAMNPEKLVTRRSGVGSAAELAELIADAFGEADEDDVSYFYISTHGVWNQMQPNEEMTLLLSDGHREEGVNARRLRELFDTVPGTKVLFIDACHSGAMIGKGVQDVFDNVFVSGDYKVICSSGGAEESWYWSGMEEESGVFSAMGYFSGALVNALSARGGFAADDNDDGRITLSELKRYLRMYHGASTVQTYPEEDDFVLLSYSAEGFASRSRSGVMENICFEDGALSRDNPTVSLSYTMLEPARVAYMLVYQRYGRWDFEGARLLWDNEERIGIFGDLPGYLNPGRKSRSITLTQEDTASYGYVLLQVITVTDSEVTVAASQVLCVPPENGHPRISVTVGSAFCPEQHEELTFVVNHAFPCELTVTVETPEGEPVRRLLSRQATRPQQLLPTGTSCTWTGCTADGEMAAPGQYRLHVRAYVGTEVYECWSAPFLLADPEG